MAGSPRHEGELGQLVRRWQDTHFRRRFGLSPSLGFADGCLAAGIPSVLGSGHGGRCSAGWSNTDLWGSDGQILVLDRETGDLRLRLGHHGGGIVSMVLSPDGSTLATSGEDGEIQLWRAASQSSVTPGRPPARIEAGLVAAGGPGSGVDGWRRLFEQRQPEHSSGPAHREASADAALAARLRELKIPFEYQLDFNRERRVDSPKPRQDGNAGEPIPLPDGEFHITKIPAETRESRQSAELKRKLTKILPLSSSFSRSSIRSVQRVRTGQPRTSRSFGTCLN